MPVSSARFSTLPDVRLPIGRSRQARCLYLLLSLALAWACLVIWLDGYRVVALLTALGAGALIASGAGGLPLDYTIEWRRGQWLLDAGGQRFQVRVDSRAVCLPWLVYLPVTCVDSGHFHRLWLFADAMDRAAWRQLRVRLVLERPQC